MRTDERTVAELRRLLDEYTKVIEQWREQGVLMKNTATTYLIHSNNFVRWCEGKFEPGGRNIP